MMQNAQAELRTARLRLQLEEIGDHCVRRIALAKDAQPIILIGRFFRIGPDLLLSGLVLLLESLELFLWSCGLGSHRRQQN
jgi:hypothetical protein